MRLLAPALLAAALAGCATRPPPVPEAPPGPPIGVDGRYRGTARLIQSHNRACPRSGPRTYEVDNGTVTFSYQDGRRRVPLTAQAGPDGRFDTSDGVGRLQGTLRDGTLEFTIASPQCEHHWTMRKVL